MTMNRRAFTKTLFGAIAAITLPVKMLAVGGKSREMAEFERFGVAAEKTATQMRQLTEATKKASAAIGHLGHMRLWDVALTDEQVARCYELSKEDRALFDGCNDYVNAYDGGSMADAFESDEGSLMIWRDCGMMEESRSTARAGFRLLVGDGR